MKVLDEQRKIQEYVEKNDSEKIRIDEFNKKNVMNEDEVIEMMRAYSGKSDSGRNGEDAMFSIGSTGGRRNEDYFTKNSMNVVWSTYRDDQNGVDSLFGFDEGWDDGPMW